MSFDFSETLKLIANSHFAAGAAGGLVRSFYVKEAYGLALTRTLAGGVSAYYISPIILWGAPRFLEMTQADLLAFQAPAGAAASFLVGLLGIFVSTTIERVIKKRFGVNDAKQ